MRGEDDGLGEPVQALDDPPEARLGDVRLTVDRGDDVAAGVVARPALAGDRGEAQARVGHHVADDLDLAADALGLECLARALLRGEEQRRDAVHLDARPLFGHGEVAAPQARLDVGDRQAGRDRCARPRERRVRVAEDDDPVGPLGADRLEDRRLHPFDLGGVQVEPVARRAEAELVEEDLRKLAIPVLSRVKDDLVDPRVAERDGERGRLDELRPVADDGEHLHGGQPSVASARSSARRASAV